MKKEKGRHLRPKAASFFIVRGPLLQAGAIRKSISALL
jgi:hypothetical protein